MRIVLLIAVTLLSASEAKAQEAADENVRSAVVGLYAALSAKDANAVVRYMLPDGYTEFSEDGSRLSVLDQEYIRNALASDVEIDLAVRDLEVTSYGDAGIVTGYRVGSIKLRSGSKSEATLRLSMVWVKQSGEWRLAHVHLSPSRTVLADSATVRDVHDAWFEGLLSEDTTIVSRVLSPDVTLGFPGGDLMPRETFLSYLQGGDLFYDAADHHALQVRVYGDAAILTGQSTLRYRFRGVSDSERLTYTAVYVRSGIGWQMVGWQSTTPR